MAVYAAYRHIELDKIGYGKKRVLKPPGGGSSDIFGPAEEAGQSARRNQARQAMHSALFSDQMETTVRAAAAAAAAKPDGNPVTGEGYAIANGVKESAATNGVAEPSPPKENGVAAAAKSAPPSRQGRVPPGGYSSGLW